VTTAAALWYDGRTSAAQPVSIMMRAATDGPRLVIVWGDGSIEHAFAACRSDVGVGDAHWRLELPGGGSLEITEPAAWNAILHEHQLQRGARALGLFERRWVVVAAAAVLTGLLTWAGFRHGVPALVERGIALMPQEMDTRIGLGGLALLDQQLFGPSSLPPARREHLRTAFAGVARDTGMEDRVRLEFRDGKDLGPNAFALPDGIVVLTDSMAGLAQHDDELRAVFAHEIGHVQHRHAMRALLAGSLNGLLAVVVLGDISAASTLIAGVPVTLAHAANSREFEHEADDVARQWMRQANVASTRLGDLLLRLEREAGSHDWGYLSTHPSVAERVQATQH
jgi:Zn-dependent protease with chaperone function